MADDLEQRLKSHAQAFDSLLSLIPANLYYGEDVSDQWKRKKQTPEQKRAARMAKLDPDNWKSAKDVMDERAAAALKRKREDQGEDLEIDGIVLEKSKVEQDLEQQGSKRQKTTEKPSQPLNTLEKEEKAKIKEERRRIKAEQKAIKKARRQARRAELRDKKGQKKLHKSQLTNTDEPGIKQKLDSNSDEDDDDNGDDGDDDNNETIVESKPGGNTEEVESIASSSDSEQPEIFSPPQESAASSISSIQVAPPDTKASKYKSTQDHSNISDDNITAAKERLQAAISNFRAERKADGPEGREPRNRQELLEFRRQKDEQRRAAKKAQKQKEKEEEARRQDEEIERRFSPGGSGLLLASPRSPIPPTDHTTNFNFSRIAFDDGSKLDSRLTGFQDRHHQKGPMDPASALKVAQAKASRLASLDETKRLDIEQKDMWLNAKKKAQGEKIRDDTNLLKRALKRQQTQKRKSEREWDGRIDGVQKSQEMRQKKRTENIAKRRDEKGNKGGSGHNKNKKVKKRPGFEGSFRGRTSSGKKK